MTTPTFELQDCDVHVRSVRLRASDAMVSQLESTLSADERDRAARFHSDSLKHSYIAGRGALRILLGRYLSMPPTSLSFIYGPNGKPSVHGPLDLAFNTTHSGGVAAFAFTLGCDVGIDIEQVREIPEMMVVTKRFFSPQEIEEWMSLPEDQRDLGFYLCWTRRESYIKAVAQSLSSNFDRLQVSLRPGGPAVFVQIPDEDQACAWSLHNLDLVPGYAAALTYRDAKRAVKVFPLVDLDDLLATP